MTDYIKREDAVKIIERLAKQLEPPINIRLADVRSGVLSAKWLVEDMQSTDVVEVVRCKDCKHRQIDTQEEGNGFDYEFPEEYGCPGYCDDGYYSQRFKDDFYCACGERAEE